MKKKLLPVILAVACTATCALAFTACDSEDPKVHTATQWEQAFESALSNKDYEWREKYCIKGDVDEFGYDKYDYPVSYIVCDTPNNYFTSSYYYSERTDMTTIFKKGNRYYKGNDVYNLERLSAEDFETEKNNIISGTDKVATLLLNLYKSRYADFKSFGSGSGGSDGISYHNYLLRDSTFKMETATQSGTKEVEYNVEKVEVSLIDNSSEIHQIYFTGITPKEDVGDLENEKLQFIYERGLSKSYLENFDNVYEIDGKTFELHHVEVNAPDSIPEAEYLAYYDWSLKTVQDNQGKTVTHNLNGTLSGDIVINDELISTYTLTDDLGVITVTNGTTTLTGECSNYVLTLTLTQKAMDGITDIKFIFTFYDLNWPY